MPSTAIDRLKKLRIIFLVFIIHSMAWTWLTHSNRGYNEWYQSVEQFDAPWPTIASNNERASKLNDDVTPNHRHQEEQVERCALCFFGLPRSYKGMVLPSIEKNVLIPNARHHCDIFVHYYFKLEEAAGRYNLGGKIDPNEILLLETAVSNYTKGVTVQFTNQTDAQFFEKRKVELHRYHNTTDKDGNLAYYPWKEDGWTKITQDNLIRQWHSVEASFRLMEQHAQQNNINYTRVAMLRNDVMYLTPIDIMKMDDVTLDTENRHFMIPPFSGYPVNDRMIYGPYEAVKVWSTKRFELIEERVQDPEAAGMVMHSERFMNESIFASIEKLGFSRHLNPDICFVRTRANSVALFNDCLRAGGARGFPDEKSLKRRVQEIFGRECKKIGSARENRNVKYLKC